MSIIGDYYEELYEGREPAESNREIMRLQNELYKAQNELAQAKEKIYLLREALGMVDDLTEAAGDLSSDMSSSGMYAKAQRVVTRIEKHIAEALEATK